MNTGDKLKVGFTGTQHGMSHIQRENFHGYLEGLSYDFNLEFHHGDCIGADREAHHIAIELGIPVIIHPPENSSKRAFCSGAENVVSPRPYLERNRDIAYSTQILIATPFEQNEKLRSGTWATIRYAKKKYDGVIVIFYPDGTMSTFYPPC